MWTIGRRAPRWRGWNRYSISGGEGKVGDNRKREHHGGGAGTGTESLGLGEMLETIGRRAPRWTDWNRYRVPGVGGNVGDDMNESVTLERQKQSPWGWGKSLGMIGRSHCGGAGTGTGFLGVGD